MAVAVAANHEHDCLPACLNPSFKRDQYRRQASHTYLLSQTGGRRRVP